HDVEAVPDHAGAEDQRDHAVERLHPALAPGPDQAQHEVGPHVAVGAYQLARDDHHAPDHEVDDHLLGPADGVGREQVAADDLDEADQHGDRAEQTHKGALDAIPRSVV